MIENNQIIFLLVTYFITSIPFGLIVTRKFLAKDIRDHGSKNIGATNVARVGGKKLGALTLILDALKGSLMVMLAINYFSASDNFDFFIALTAFISVFGHIFPIYLKFKGGKGVATTLAVILTIDPFIGLLSISIWFMTFFAFRISAVSSLIGVFSIIPLSYFMAFDQDYTYLSIALFVMVLVRHKENIVRLISKEENKF